MRRRLLSIISLLSMIGCVGFVAMLPFAYHFYTSVGLDFEKERGGGGGGREYTYVRLRWPGDGSFFVGGETIRIARRDRPTERIDLAGTFFQRPRPPAPRSILNKMGFWFVVGEGGLDSGAEASFWIGVPAILPAVALAAPGWWWLRARRKARDASRSTASAG